MRRTPHAEQRCQQRGIPQLILHWLSDYGREQFDGRGARILWFDKASRRRLEREVGREPVRRMHEWLNAYAVVAVRDGQIITTGHRYKRIHH